jgi:hypothetical protein
LILEDLDSLINDRNRSFFLNELDGLEGNEGLLVIASTNHFERLDPGLSNRPSRFDRKYLFDDPDHQERVLYAKYWQEKLKDNDEISFPVSLVEEVAELTQGFSFAYLKEAFVSTLVRTTTTVDGVRVEFPVVLKSQIMTLRKELGEQTPAPIDRHSPVIVSLGSASPIPVLPLPTDVSSADRSGSRVIRMASGPGSTVHSSTPHLQGGVPHAPPSAYPQVSVMPGSLPSTRPAWRVEPGPSISSTRFSSDNPVDREVHAVPIWIPTP